MRHPAKTCTRILVALAAALPLALPAQALNPAPAAPVKSEVEVALSKIDSVPRLLAAGRQYEQAGKWQNYQYTMQRVLELRPFAGNIRLELAAAYAMQDKKSEAYDILVRMQSTGYGYPLADDDRFALVRGTGVWDYVVKGFADNAKSNGTGRLAMTLPKEDLLVESIAYDGKRKQFLTGSVRTGTVYRVADDGKLTAFITPDATNGLLGVFDLVADAAHDTLWIAGSGIPHVKHAKAADYGQGGLWKFQLSTGEFQGKWLVPTGGKNRMIASVAVSPQGQPFVADHANADVFTLVSDQLKVIVRNPKLTSVRAIAVSGDGKTLYFADHELGLFGLDLGSGRAFDVGAAPNVTLFGIESLYWYDGALVGVQNGIEPRRSVRFELGRDGHLVTRAQQLDGNRAEFAALSRGTVVGDEFFFVANSQKANYDGYGVPRDANAIEGARIFASNAKVARDIKLDAPPVSGRGTD